MTQLPAEETLWNEIETTKRALLHHHHIEPSSEVEWPHSIKHPIVARSIVTKNFNAADNCYPEREVFPDATIQIVMPVPIVTVRITHAQ